MKKDFEIWHDEAAICENGHLVSGNAAETPCLIYCSTCGAKIYGNSHARSKNDFAVTLTIPLIQEFIPNYCEKCGAPFQWKLAKDRAETDSLTESKELKNE